MGHVLKHFQPAQVLLRALQPKRQKHLHNKSNGASDPVHAHVPDANLGEVHQASADPLDRIKHLRTRTTFQQSWSDWQLFQESVFAYWLGWLSYYRGDYPVACIQLLLVYRIVQAIFGGVSLWQGSHDLSVHRLWREVRPFRPSLWKVRRWTDWRLLLGHSWV